MLPTGSHRGILAQAMLGRGPKGYLRPALEGELSGSTKQYQPRRPAHKVVTGLGVPPGPIRAGSPVSGVRTGQSEARKVASRAELFPCSLGTQIPSLRAKAGG